MEAGVNFVAADFRRPTVHILTAVTEHEANMISERTQATLAAAKPRGVKLGGNRGVGASTGGRRRPRRPVRRCASSKTTFYQKPEIASR
jgi:DNA invertase Pin-like site-specific DNA recombinase